MIFIISIVVDGIIILIIINNIIYMKDIHCG
jgi:hypothetical protein